MPMTSFIEGAHAGQRLAEPIARGVETRAHMGLEGQLHGEDRRLQEAETELRRELHQMRMRESQVRGAFEEERKRQLEARNQPVRHLSEQAEYAARELTDLQQRMQDPNITQGDRMALELQAGVIQQWMQGNVEQAAGGEPEATVTRKLPDGTSVRYKAPLGEVERQFAQEGGGAGNERIVHEIEQIDNELAELAIREAEGRTRTGRTPMSPRIPDRREELLQKKDMLQRMGGAEGQAAGSVGRYVPAEGVEPDGLRRAYQEGRRDPEEYHQRGVETETQAQESRREEQDRQRELREQREARPLRSPVTERGVMFGDQETSRQGGRTDERTYQPDPQDPQRRLRKARQQRERLQERIHNIERTFEGDFHIPENRRQGFEQQLQSARERLAEIEAEIDLLEEAAGETRRPQTPIGGMAP